MPPRKPTETQAPENAIAKKALEAIQQIDADAKEKKLAQLESLQAARAALLQRRSEIDHQLELIAKGISTITGKPSVSIPTGEKRSRRDLDEVRDRVGRWMVGRMGEKFAARDLVREFPELRDTPMSYFLKPLVQDGKIKTDLTEGPKRLKYFVAEG